MDRLIPKDAIQNWTRPQDTSTSTTRRKQSAVKARILGSTAGYHTALETLALESKLLHSARKNSSSVVWPLIDNRRKTMTTQAQQQTATDRDMMECSLCGKYAYLETVDGTLVCRCCAVGVGLAAAPAAGGAPPQSPNAYIIANHKRPITLARKTRLLHSMNKGKRKPAQTRKNREPNHTEAIEHAILALIGKGWSTEEVNGLYAKKGTTHLHHLQAALDHTRNQEKLDSIVVND